MRARGAATALAMALAQPPPPSPTPPSRWMRCEAASSSMPSSSSSVGGGFGDLLPSRDGRSSLRLSPPQRSWVVRTEANVKKWKRKAPEPPCVVCNGSGKVECSRCQGKGRENHIDLMILPEGEWPKWCRTCGGCGLEYCSRCLGAGEYRERVWFHFIETEANESERFKKDEIQENDKHQT